LINGLEGKPQEVNFLAKYDFATLFHFVKTRRVLPCCNKLFPHDYSQSFTAYDSNLVLT